MTEREVGLHIRARDAATGAFNKARTVVAGFSDFVSRHAARIKSAWEVAGRAATGINQGLELAKKALELTSRAYDATIGKALEWRTAGDAAKRDMDALAKASDRFAVAIGNVAVPLVRTFAQALTPVLVSMTAWLARNRELVASRLVDWLARVASTLNSGVATAALLVARAWFGWKMAIDVVAAGAQAAFAVILSQADSVLGAMAAVSRAVGADDVAARLDGAAASARTWGAEMERASDANVAEAARVVRELEGMERQIDKVHDAINTGIGEAAKKAAANAKAAFRSVDPAAVTFKLGDATGPLEAYRAEMARLQKESADRAAHQLAYFFEVERRKLELAQETAEKLDALETARLDKARERAQALAGILSEWGSTILEDFKSVGRLQNEVVVEMVRNEQGLWEERERVVSQATRTIGDVIVSSLQRIGVYVATQIAQFLLLRTLLSIFGLFSGGPGGALAGFGAFLLGDSSGVQGFATGGVVPGFDTGQDSTIIRARPGETIRTAAEERALAMGNGGGGGGPTTINVPTLVPLTGPDADYFVRKSIIPALERIRRDEGK